MAQFFRDTNILPPLRSVWKDEAFTEKREFWSNQAVGSIYADLADDVPPQYGHPYMLLAKRKLGDVLAACADYYAENGEEGFAEFTEMTLKETADGLRRITDRGSVGE